MKKHLSIFILLLLAVSSAQGQDFAERTAKLSKDMNFKKRSLRFKDLSNTPSPSFTGINKYLNTKTEVEVYEPGRMQSRFDFDPGLGLTTVDSSVFYMARPNASYTFGNARYEYDRYYNEIVVGNVFQATLDMPLRYSSEKFAFRKADYESAAQILSSVQFNYQFGSQLLQTNASFDQVSNQSLGFGSIMYQYNNSPSYESRRNGLQGGVTFRDMGIETRAFISDITKAGVVGLDFTFNPLQLLRGGGGRNTLPILKQAVLGFNYAGDFHEDAGVTGLNYYIDTTQGAPRYIVTGKKDVGSINIINTYAGLKLFGDNNYVQLYADYSKIFKFGSNFAAGLYALAQTEDRQFVAIFNVQRRFQQDKYLPTYFDALYETERFQVVTSSDNNTTVPLFRSKAAALDTVKELRGSTYGEALFRLGPTLSVTAAYQKLDLNEYGGETVLVAELSNGATIQAYTPGYIRVYGGYYKKGIKQSKDIFTFNEDALFFGVLDYTLTDLFTLSVQFRQTFEAIRDVSNNVIGYAPQRRFQPEIRFNLGL